LPTGKEKRVKKRNKNHQKACPVNLASKKEKKKRPKKNQGEKEKARKKKKKTLEHKG